LYLAQSASAKLDRAESLIAEALADLKQGGFGPIRNRTEWEALRAARENIISVDVCALWHDGKGE